MILKIEIKYGDYDYSQKGDGKIWITEMAETAEITPFSEQMELREALRAISLSIKKLQTKLAELSASAQNSREKVIHKLVLPSLDF